MLSSLRNITNVDKFEIYNSRIVINSGFKIFDEGSDSLIFEFPNIGKRRVDRFLKWGNELIFSDTSMGEYHCYDGNSCEKIPYSIIDVINSEYAIATDVFRRTNLIDKEYKVVWKKQEFYHNFIFCSQCDSIAFLVKDENGNFNVKSIKVRDGSLNWETSLSEFDFVYLIDSFGSNLYLQTNTKLQSDGRIVAPVLIAIDMESGEVTTKIDFNKEGLPKSRGFLKFDYLRSRFIYPTYEIDFEENCSYRSYLLDSKNVPATIGSPQVGVWNNKYYVDCYNKDSTYDSSSNKKITHPYEILIFDRITGELINKTTVNFEDHFVSIKEFKIDQDKLYALDTNNNLRIYDFSMFAEAIA